MSKETGGPAFPVVQWETDDDGNLRPRQTNGMTLRDYFAAKAMQGLLASPRNPVGVTQDVTDVLIANLAYKMADAMLKAREQ